jgi:hypothetical protein
LTEHQEVAVAQDMMSNFEIPTEVRQLAVKSVDEAKRAFDSLVVAAQKVTTSLAGQAAAAQSGSKEVHSKVRTFAEGNKPPDGIQRHPFLKPRVRVGLQRPRDIPARTRTQ